MCVSLLKTGIAKLWLSPRCSSLFSNLWVRACLALSNQFVCSSAPALLSYSLPSTPSPCFHAPLANASQRLQDFLSTTQRDGDGGVTESGRRDLLIWLREFNLFFGLSPGTFAVAAVLVDRMLECTRVKPEHADLVGVACLLIAAKDGEPEDLQPTLRELSRNCEGAFSETDIERMEALVHRKLGTTMPQLVVPIDYLDEMRIIAADSVGGRGLVSTASFETLAINVMLSCTFHYELMSYRPSTLALAVLSTELSRLHEMERYARVLESIREVMCIPQWDLDSCRRCVARCLKLRPHGAV